MKPKPAKTSKVSRGQWLTLAISLIAIASTGLMYYLKQTEIDSLMQSNFDLQTRVTSLENRAQLGSGIYTSTKNVSVKVFTPLKNSAVNSPLHVMGMIPGNWSFEASFPIELVDKSGNVLAKTTGQVIGDWMTANHVPFTATLNWQGSYTGPAKLILKNDNPSGMSDKADYVEIQINVK